MVNKAHTMMNKFSPTASWLALLASIALVLMQSWIHSAGSAATVEVEQRVIRQRLDDLDHEVVKRREMDDLKDSVHRIENKLDNVLANQRKGER